MHNYRMPDGASVSVAMATYNGAEFIEEQLASLASQTHRPHELVVSDDRSGDETLSLVRAFARTAPFDVKIAADHQRLGFADNFLNAAEQCSGAYIAFCDQDDAWLPGKLEAQVRRMRQDGSLLSMHRLAITNAALEPTGEVWDQDIEGDRTFEPTELNPYGTGWGNSMLFDARLARLLPRDDRPAQPEFPHLPLSHDHWIYTLAAALGRVSQMMEPLLLYRQHGSNTYGVGPMPLSIRIRAALSVPTERLVAEGTFDREIADLLARIGREHPEWREATCPSHAVYRARAALCDMRLATYAGEGVVQRLKAFRQSRLVDDYTPSLKSSFKEAVLGVLGLGRIINPPLMRLLG